MIFFASKKSCTFLYSDYFMKIEHSVPVGSDADIDEAGSGGERVAQLF